MNFDNIIIKNRIIYLHTSSKHEYDGILESEDLSQMTLSDASFFFINGSHKVRGQD
jgi:hypothetical protein